MAHTVIVDPGRAFHEAMVERPEGRWPQMQDASGGDPGTRFAVAAHSGRGLASSIAPFEQDIVMTRGPFGSERLDRDGIPLLPLGSNAVRIDGLSDGISDHTDRLIDRERPATDVHVQVRGRGGLFVQPPERRSVRSLSDKLIVAVTIIGVSGVLVFASLVAIYALKSATGIDLIQDTHLAELF